MAWWRTYIDAENGDHSRVYDFEADVSDPERPLDPPEVPKDAKLQDGETVNQTVSLGENPT